jgi:hypothetical protein
MLQILFFIPHRILLLLVVAEVELGLVAAVAQADYCLEH